MKVGDIIVRMDVHPQKRIQPGDIAKIIKEKAMNEIDLENFDAMSIFKKQKFCKATDKQIAAYKQGITNINDIPEDFQTEYIPLLWN